MDRNLAKTVVAIFRDAPAGSDELARFRQKQWERSYDWLDTSGIALYLLDRLKQLSLEGEIPKVSLLRLEEKQKDNRGRTEQLFYEFKAINTSFQQAGFKYVNLKGLTLIPSYCSNPDLRFQADLDFLLNALDAQRCKEILDTHGYRLTGVNGSTWEFKAGGDIMPTLRDMYKPKAQRSVEIHFSEVTAQANRVDGRLARRQMQTWRDFEFPALSESDKFIAQSIHLCRHVRSEWTRLSWVLEYWRFLRVRADDGSFWNEVRERVGADLTAATAIRMSSKVAKQAFGSVVIPAMDEWTIGSLPVHCDRWIERYGEGILLTEFPGSKLYLLLDAHEGQKVSVKNKLFPLHLPPRIVHWAPDASFRERLNGYREQIRYLLFRLRFHVIAGGRHILEVARWRFGVWSSCIRRDLRSKEAD